MTVAPVLLDRHVSNAVTPHPAPELPADVVIDVQDVTIRRGTTDLVAAVNWRVSQDERWVVLGPNGAGKTTLLGLASARLHPTKGVVHVLGDRLGRVDVFEVRPRVGISSASLADRIPGEETVHDVVVTAAYAVVGRFREEYELLDDVRARALLDQFGVAQLADRRYGTLSEGERKRVQIARALMTDPEVLLLDEPAAGLDLGGREDLLRRLSELAQDPAAPTLVLVTHHVEEIPPGITHALLMRGGKVVAQGKASEVLTAQHLSATFGLPLAVHDEAGRYYARAL
jgi:iron complex transport system ATP-binding protein